MEWSRVRAADKLAWREDLQEDPTISDVQKRIVSVIAKHWNGETMHAECSLTFLAAGAGTTKKVAHKYLPTLIESGRISIKRKATATESTLWALNWYYRGSAWVRLNNAGNPVLDCRQESPSAAHDSPPPMHIEESPTDANGNAGGPPTRGPIPPLKRRDNSRPLRSDRLGDDRGASEEEDENSNPHKLQPGFAKWKVAHAEYKDEDTFVAHLRSGKARKFVLRFNTDSDEYWSLDEALAIGGEADAIVGNMVAMSTNRSGPKTFMRAGPRPWQSCCILSGDSTDDGSAKVRVEYGDGMRGDLRLSPSDVERLVAVCGSEDDAIGAMVRFRLLPDDALEFRFMAVQGEQGREVANDNDVGFAKATLAG